MSRPAPIRTDQCPRCGLRYPEPKPEPTPCVPCRPHWERAQCTWRGRVVEAPRMDLVAHVRHKLALGQYGNDAQLGVVSLHVSQHIFGGAVCPPDGDEEA